MDVYVILMCQKNFCVDSDTTFDILETREYTQ